MNAMIQTFAAACAAHARAGDLISVFLLDPTSSSRGVVGAMRKALMASSSNLPSPIVYNETAKAWFMHHANAAGPGTRGPGEATLYTATPDPTLPVTRVVRGTVLESTTVQDTGYNHHDTLLTLEILDDRALMPGDRWLPPRSWR